MSESCSITFRWRARGGGEHSYKVIGLPDFSRQTIARARQQAIEVGYPGHSGGWWNYAVDDFHGWLVRRGWSS